MRDDRPHAWAWWIWAGGLSITALKLSNPVTMLALGGVLIIVGALRQSPAPWGRSFPMFLKLGGAVIVIRILFQIVLGQRLPGHVLFTLPTLGLPSWAQGVSLGGPVTAESLIVAATEGLKLALVLLAFGVANAVASPREVLRALPGIFNEIAVAVTVGMCFTPEIIAAVSRVRSARKLRGRPTKGFAGVRGIAVPVLEDALEHSMQLAASMGARGFGRASSTTSRLRSWICGIASGSGAIVLIAGVYGLLSAQGTVPFPGFSCVLGIVLLAGGIFGSGRRSVRTRYRPAPFGWHSAICAVSGWLVVISALILSSTNPSVISYSPYPLAWPAVSLAALGGMALGLLPLVVSKPGAQLSSPTRQPPAQVTVDA